MTYSVTEEYSHPIVSIEPSEVELQKALEEKEKRLAEEEAAKQKEKEEKAKKRGGKRANS